MSHRHTHINKRAISERMFRYAANFLGIKHVEQLDPLIAIFVESLSHEVYKLSHEIDNMEQRIEDSLTDLLSPNHLLGVQPAHCIVHAEPIDEEVTITEDFPFSLQNKILLPSGINELYFYPILATKLYKTHISYISYNGLCYKLDKYLNRTLIGRSRESELDEYKSYYVGLSFDDAITEIENLSFYVDFIGIANKDEYLNLLSFATWHINGKTYTIKQGLANYTQEKDKSKNVVDLFREFDTNHQLNKSILNYYDKHFFTITESLQPTQTVETIPEEIKKYYQKEVDESSSSSFLWVEIRYPSTLIDQAIIESLLVSVNAFPVSNKKLYSSILEVNNYFPIIPLETGNNESYLGIESITDSRNRFYSELAFGNIDNKEYKTYSLRKGGYERYNKRDARLFLVNLLSFLENYSAVNMNTIEEDEDNTVKDILKLIKHIKKQLHEAKYRIEKQNYILVDELDDSEIFFLKYWVSNGELANGIRQYTELESIHPEKQIKLSSTYLLSSTIGGKYPPNAAEKQHLQVQSLTKATLLITDRDIIGFCKSYFSNIISNVIVENKFAKSTTNQNEFIETINVTIIPKKNMTKLLTENDKERILELLQKKSPMTYKYQVFINEIN